MSAEGMPEKLAWRIQTVPFAWVLVLEEDAAAEVNRRYKACPSLEARVKKLEGALREILAYWEDIDRDTATECSPEPDRPDFCSEHSDSEGAIPLENCPFRIARSALSAGKGDK